jgi:hypothetical protein
VPGADRASTLRDGRTLPFRRCVHVLNEHVDAKHDDAADEAWLHGRYTYVLYR